MLFKTSTSTKVRIGFSIALLVVIAIGGAVAFAQFSFLRHDFPIMSITFSVIGCLSLATGWFCGPKNAASNEDEPALSGPSVHHHPMVFLKSFKYWGVILIISAGVLYALNASRIQPDKPVMARTIPVAIPKAPVVFPALDLQGVILHGDKSSALIDGRVLRIGEGIGNVTVVGIAYDHVEVALEGQTNVIYMPE